MTSLLQTISDMEARLAELRQQLSYQGQGHGQGRRQGYGRVPYPYVRPPHVNAVPLQPPHSAHVLPFSPSSSHPSHPSHPPRSSYPPRSSRVSAPYPTIPLSAVLRPQEVVTFQVILHKDENGQPVYGTMEAVFDGEKLKITKSDYVPSMVDVQSVKPGELLYRFIDDLKQAGHLKRTFTVAPWKLCSVVRDGNTLSLEVLRRQHLQSS